MTMHHVGVRVQQWNGRGREYMVNDRYGKDLTGLMDALHTTITKFASSPYLSPETAIAAELLSSILDYNCSRIFHSEHVLPVQRPQLWAGHTTYSEKQLVDSGIEEQKVDLIKAIGGSPVPDFLVSKGVSQLQLNSGTSRAVVATKNATTLSRESYLPRHYDCNSSCAEVTTDTSLRRFILGSASPFRIPFIRIRNNVIVGEFGQYGSSDSPAR